MAGFVDRSEERGAISGASTARRGEGLRDNGVIDFDRNATAPLHPAARAAMMAALEGDALGNPSSVHRLGQRARAVVERGRRAIAAALGASSTDVVLTSGGTEADALAILGVARALAVAGRPSAVACSAIEHPAVTGACGVLRRAGHGVVTIPVDAHGRLDPASIGALVRAHPELGLVSVTAAHHELGNVTDVRAIVDAVRAARPEVLVHVDAVQALGKLPVSVAGWGVDLLSVSAHKVGGPAGIGALVCARHVAIEPLWGGGRQQSGRRPGTESAWATAGFAAAATAAASAAERWASEVAPLGARLRAGLVACGGRLFGDPDAHLGNTALAAFDGCDGHLVMVALDLAGFACSTGAACSTGTVEPSAVLLALGCDRAVARGALRFSLGPERTAAEIDALCSALPDILASVRAATARLGAA